MSGYQVREIEHAIGGHPYRLRVLSDTQQFADPDGHGERAGISSANCWVSLSTRNRHASPPICMASMRVE